MMYYLKCLFQTNYDNGIIGITIGSWATPARATAMVAEGSFPESTAKFYRRNTLL
jgi:hypothetical protein